MNMVAYIVWVGFLPSGVRVGVGVGDGGSVGCRPTDATRWERLTDSFGFDPQLCSGTAQLPALRTRQR